MILLDGKKCAKEIRREISTQVLSMSRKPCLAVVLVGDNLASSLYVSNKERFAQEVGFRSITKKLPKTITQRELVDVVVKLNQDQEVDGYIIQLPLPEHIDVEMIVNLIDPRKDVDGFTPFNQGLLLRGFPKIVPATPRGVVELLRRNDIQFSGKEVVIVGRSSIVGKPLANLLLLKGLLGDATVTVAHSSTNNLSEVCRRADILISAIGRSKFITTEFVKPNSVVVDVGINAFGDELCGDVDFNSVKNVVHAITPVPGGVGPMTIAMLLQNTLETLA